MAKETTSRGAKRRVRQPAATRRAVMEELEPRLLLSADAAGALGTTAALHDAELPSASPLLASDATPAVEAPAVEARRRELVIIDPATPDYERLLADLRRDATDNRQLDVVVLESDRDGVEQLSDVLSSYTNLGAIHLIAHGSDGQIQLGNSALDLDGVLANARAIQGWGQALAADGDLLIYGCNVAADHAGQALIDTLSRLTGADVAASNDLTGAASRGGDWVLEAHVGSIETLVAVSDAIRQQWQGVLVSYSVSNTNDAGLGSLRQAITDANASAGVADSISFSIGSGTQTITLSSTLTITDNLTIDGSTQSGFTGTPLIRIDGGLAGFDGLTLSGTSDNSVIRSLMITRFRDGIVTQAGADNITIAGNWIGTTGTGTGNAGRNTDDGLDLAGNNAIIGGTGANDRNVITNNADEGITSVASGLVIQGNYIGVDPDGSTGGGNVDVGIALFTGTGNTIGGLTAAERNVISMNNEGIEINSGSNVVQGNYIGTDSGGTLNRGNRIGDGIQIQGSATNTVVGGTAAGAGNLIAFNAGNGISIYDGTGHQVLGNSIFSNADLGIDLGTLGVTANDANDVDGGDNNQQNFPVLGSVGTTGNQVTITGTLNSQASTTYRIEFFANNANDNEGQRYLGSTDVVTPAGTPYTVSFTTTLTASVGAGEYITATATDPSNNTSEFSAQVVAYSGMAIWANDNTTPGYAQWNGSGFGPTANSQSTGEWAITRAVEAPTRNEIIAVGVDTAGRISGQTWNGSAWTAFSFNDLVDLSTTSYWSFQLAYEQQSGDAMLVWDNGTSGTASLSYRTWNGTSWSSAQTITTPVSGEAVQLRLAADPNSDSMVLAVSGTPTANDYALVWNGTSWGNSVTLDTSSGADRTEIHVAYESHSGQAVVVYDADGSTNAIAYRTWDGSSWSAQQSLSAPAGIGASNDANFSVMASDPGSDRIALAVVTNSSEIWISVWDGAAWSSQLAATTSAAINSAPIVGLAFEHDSGDLLAVYGKSGNNSVFYRTWTNGAGWSSEATGPNIGAVPNTLTLSADPGSNHIMLGSHDANQDVNFAEWTGSAWNAVSGDMTTDTGTAGGYEPIAFVWYGNNRTPVISTTALSVAENNTVAGTVLSIDADGDVRTYSVIGGADQARFTINPTTGALSFVSAPDYEIPVDVGTNNVYDVVVRVSDGNGGTDSQSIAVTVTNASEAPVLAAIEGSALGYTENAAATAITSTVTLNDVDNATMASATVQITVNYQNGQDVLSFTNTGSITGSWNPATGTLTLTGSDTVANYQAALRAVTYSNSSDNPSTAVRTVTFAAYDGATYSNLVTRNIAVTAVNDAPTLSSSYALNAIAEDDVSSSGTLVADIVSAGVSDPDSGALQGIAVIGVDNTNGTWQYTLDGTSWLAIGNATLSAARLLPADATTAVRFVPNANYNGVVFPFSYKAWDQTSGIAGDTGDASVSGGTTAFSTGTSATSVTVTAVNDAPVLTSNGGGASATVSLQENSTAVTTVTSTDVDGGAASYSILAGGDGLKFTINPGTGVLSFVTAPDYENPTDGGGNNTYDLTVQVSDGAGGTDTQVIAVTVTNVADGIRVTPISVVPIGSETRVNTITTDTQTINPNVAQAIATDANGNFVVVWASNLQDSSLYGVYAQRYNADGTALGAAFLVNTTTADNQLNAAVAMDAAGNFVVTWMSNLQDGDLNGIYAQRYNAAGVAQGSEFRVNTTTAGSQTTPTIAMAPTGAFVIVWTGGSQDPDASSGIYAQRFDASGVAQGSEFRVNTYTIDTQQLTSVAMDAAGNFVVVWASLNQDDGASYGVYGQRYSAGGAALGGEFLVNTTIVNSQLYHDVTMLPDGRFVVAYQSRNADGSFEVYLQRYATDGSTLGGETRVNTATVTGTQAFPSISADADGNITVVWNSTADGSGTGVVGRRLDWSGTPLTGEFQVNTTNSGNQLYPELVSQPGGGFIVAWGGNGPGDADGVFLQRYGLTTTEGGGTATFQIVLEAAPTGDVTIPISVSDGSEGSVSVGSVTFNSGNWNVAQTVTITGLQDFINDGAQRYQVVLGAATSSDANFSGLNPADLWITNLAIPNTAPVNTIPGDQTTNEDTNLVFSTGNSNAISISDGDAGGGIVNVLLAATNGTITLNGTTGLSFITGDGTADALLNFTGTIASINTALNGLVFAPTADYNGAASLQMITGDLGNSGTGGALGDTDTVNITVNPVNDSPVTTPVTLASITEDSGPRLITQAELLVTATDVDGPPLTATGLAISSGSGSLVNNGDGTWTYTPALNDDTSVTFSYTVTDGSLTAAGTASLDITPVNDAPVTTPVTLTAIVEDSGPRLITQAELLANATDVDGPSVTATGLAITSGAGTLIDNGDGTWTYTPALNDSSSVSFSYTVTDGSLTTAGTASLDITPVNDSPVTTPVTLTTIVEDSGPQLITQAELLANATDPDGPSLTATGVTISSGAGTLVNNGDGTWSYTPALNDDTAVSFSYTVTDGTNSVAGTASLDITPVNDPPSTSPVTLAAIAEDSGPRLITQAELLANATDVDGPSLTATGLAISSGLGSLVDNGDGTWTYIPALNDDTSVSFSYTVTDGSLSAAGTASLDITPVNNPPVTTPVTLAPIAEDSGPRVITQAELLAGATDVDGPSLTATGLAISSGLGSLVDNGDGTWTYTPAQNDDTAVSFSYSITDGSLTAAGMASLDIAPVNDAPATTPVTLTAIAEESGPRLITQAELLANATDVDDPSLTATGVTISSGAGTLVNNGDGTWTYTPALNDDTAVSFSYTVTDGSLSTAGTATLNLTPINDPPVLGAIEGAALAYAGNGLPRTVTDTLAVSDVDSGLLTGATVAISGNYAGGEDVLAFTDQSGITGSWDALTGVLTLTGNATLADYEAALRSVTYVNTNGTPSALTRTVSVTVSDGGATSTLVTRDIAVTAITNPVDVIPPVDPGPPPDPVVKDPPPADPPPAGPGPAGGPTETPVLPGGDPLPVMVEPAGFTGSSTPALDGTESGRTADRRSDIGGVPPKFFYDAVRNLLDFDSVGLPRLDNAALWTALDSMYREMSGDGTRSGALAAQFAGGASLFLSIGFVNWIVRGGSLAAALLSTMPMWRGLDPLPVLLARRQRDADDKPDLTGDADERRELDRVFAD